MSLFCRLKKMVEKNASNWKLWEKLFAFFCEFESKNPVEEKSQPFWVCLGKYWALWENINQTGPYTVDSDEKAFQTGSVWALDDLRLEQRRRRAGKTKIYSLAGAAHAKQISKRNAQSIPCWSSEIFQGSNRHQWRILTWKLFNLFWEKIHVNHILLRGLLHFYASDARIM